MSMMLKAMMYVPGNDEAKLAKIASLPPNAYIIDLEDAVAVQVKAQARTLVNQYLNSYEGDQQLWVRINGIETGLMMDDISAVVTASTVGIVVPKVEGSRTIHVVEFLLDSFERKVGIEPGKIKIMPLIESAVGITHLDEVIEASKRTVCLAFGAGDYSLDLGIEWPAPGGITNPLVLSAKVKLVEASRAHGLVAPHDGGFTDIRDRRGLADEALAAFTMGFGGKHAVHPNQVETIRKCFTPSEKQMNWARKVVDAFEKSEAEGIAAVEVDGKVIDYPVAQRAQQVLALGTEELPGKATR